MECSWSRGGFVVSSPFVTEKGTSESAIAASCRLVVGESESVMDAVGWRELCGGFEEKKGMARLLEDSRCEPDNC